MLIKKLSVLGESGNVCQEDVQDSKCLIFHQDELPGLLNLQHLMACWTLMQFLLFGSHWHRSCRTPFSGTLFLFESLCSIFIFITEFRCLILVSFFTVMSFFVLQSPPPFFLCYFLFALLSQFFYTNSNNTFMYICSRVFFNQTNWHKYGRADTIQKNTDANKSQISYMRFVLINNFTHFFSVFISLLYMFRATQCSSSGESNCINISSAMYYSM